VFESIGERETSGTGSPDGISYGDSSVLVIFYFGNNEMN